MCDEKVTVRVLPMASTMRTEHGAKPCPKCGAKSIIKVYTYKKRKNAKTETTGAKVWCPVDGCHNSEAYQVARTPRFAPTATAEQVTSAWNDWCEKIAKAGGWKAVMGDW